MVGECVRFLFTGCEELQTNEWTQRTSDFAILHNKWIKIVQANQPWSYWFILQVLRFPSKTHDKLKAIRRKKEFYSLKGLVYKLNFFLIFRRWNGFYKLKSAKAWTFCLISKFQPKEKMKIIKTSWKLIQQSIKAVFLKRSLPLISLSSKGLSLFHCGNARPVEIPVSLCCWKGSLLELPSRWINLQIAAINLSVSTDRTDVPKPYRHNYRHLKNEKTARQFSRQKWGGSRSITFHKWRNVVRPIRRRERCFFTSESSLFASLIGCD